MLTGVPGDRGTVLMLFPAAFFAVLVLGALAVDVGLVQVRAREVGLAASSAADDALSALDLVELRTSGRVRLDPGRATAIVHDTVAATAPAGSRVTRIELATAPDGLPRVAVTVCLDVDLVVAPALPGTAPTRTVCRTGRTVVRRGARAGGHRARPAPTGR